jgi:hypothetical protein
MRIPLVVLLGSLALAAPVGAVSGGHPLTLQAGKMRVISAGGCEKAYPKAVIASELCAEDFANAKAPFITACGGDSGGPASTCASRRSCRSLTIRAR